MTVNIQNARVLVVGASSGIGLATAHAFADADAQLTMASRGGDKLMRAALRTANGACRLRMWWHLALQQLTSSNTTM